MKSNVLLTVNNANDFKYDVYGYIIGIKSFSVNFNKYYNVSDINSIIDKIGNKKLYISLNRLIFNDEIEKISKLLQTLSKLNIDGVFFSDLGIINIENKLNLKIKLILNQEYFINNYLTLNWFSNKNITDILLSNEITYTDIKNITTKTDVILYKKVFGYIKLSTSKRKFISSYLKHISLNKKITSGFIKDKEKKYNIIEDYYGTYIFSDYPIFLTDNIFNINIKYFIIDTFLVNKKIINDIILYYTKLHNNVKTEALLNRINKSIKTDNYFIDNRAVYKVKK